MQKKRSKKSLNHFIFLISFLIICFSLFFIINKAQPLEVKTIPLKVEVGNILGLNADTDILNFGGSIAGQKITKKITLSNGYPEDIKVRIFLDNGNITKYIYGDSYFSLSVGESKDYEINLILPDDVPPGLYEGELIIKFFK